MIALGSKWTRARWPRDYVVEVVGTMGSSVVVRQPSGECLTWPAPIFLRDYVEAVRPRGPLVEVSDVVWLRDDRRPEGCE
jgi:hypothetical protein